MKTAPYRVEVDNGGCEHCGADKSWTVVGPDDVALGQSWLCAEDAEATADLLNAAYEQGLRQPAMGAACPRED